MRYQVPQFIEVEDKIFGPLTLKQFLYVAGGGAIFFILWSVLPRFLAVLIGLPILVFFIALAFYKINGKPMIVLVEAAFQYAFSSKLYIWKKKPKTPVKNRTQIEHKKASVPKLSESKLRDLAWGLDIHETIDAGSLDDSPAKR